MKPLLNPSSLNSDVLEYTVLLSKPVGDAKKEKDHAASQKAIWLFNIYMLYIFSIEGFVLSLHYSRNF